MKHARLAKTPEKDGRTEESHLRWSGGSRRAATKGRRPDLRTSGRGRAEMAEKKRSSRHGEETSRCSSFRWPEEDETATEDLEPPPLRIALTKPRLACIHSSNMLQGEFPEYSRCLAAVYSASSSLPLCVVLFQLPDGDVGGFS
jgi:hypothetical protein